MTVYEWTESEHFFLARVRPKELFDLSTLDSPPDWDKWLREGDSSGKGTLKALNLVTMERGAFAYYVDKRKGRDRAEELIDGIREWFLQTDAIDVENLQTPPDVSDLARSVARSYRLRLEGFAAKDHLISHLGDREARKLCKNRGLDLLDDSKLTEDELRIKIRAGLLASPLECDWLQWGPLQAGLSREEWDSDTLLPVHDDPPDTYLRKLNALRAKFGGELPSPEEWRRNRS